MYQRGNERSGHEKTLQEFGFKCKEKIGKQEEGEDSLSFFWKWVIRYTTEGRKSNIYGAFGSPK